MNLVLPLEWVRAARYCELAGEPLDTVYERINDGVWAAVKMAEAVRFELTSETI